MKKRKIILGIVICALCLMIGGLSSSWAYNKGYTGQNKVEGTNVKLNIIEIQEPKLTSKAQIVSNPSSIATTQNIDVLLFNPGDKIEYNFTIKNEGILDMELNTIALGGLNKEQSEYIDYVIYPQDYLELKTTETPGSIIKTNETQEFKVEIIYKDSINQKESPISLNLTSTIIYNEKEA